MPSLIVPSPALIFLLPALVVIAPLPANIIPNKLAPNVPNDMPIHPSFHSFASFFIVSLSPFINKQDSSRDLIIFTISSIRNY